MNDATRSVIDPARVLEDLDRAVRGVRELATQYWAHSFVDRLYDASMALHDAATVSLNLELRARGIACVGGVLREWSNARHAGAGRGLLVDGYTREFLGGAPNEDDTRH